MHVGEYRHADLPAHFAKDAQTFFQSRPTKAFAGRTIRLVEAGLEDEMDTEPAGDLLQLARHIQLQLFGLDHAGAGNQKQRLVQADLETAKLHAIDSCASR